MGFQTGSSNNLLGGDHGLGGHVGQVYTSAGGPKVWQAYTHLDQECGKPHCIAIVCSSMGSTYQDYLGQHRMATRGLKTYENYKTYEKLMKHL